MQRKTTTNYFFMVIVTVGTFALMSLYGVSVNTDGPSERISKMRNVRDNFVSPTSNRNRTSASDKHKIAFIKETEAFIRERFINRKSILEERCLELATNSSSRKSNDIPKRSYYSRKYDLFLCVSPKAGASTWKTHLLEMMNKTADNPHLIWVNKLIRSKEVLSTNEQPDVKTSPTTLRIVSVRHPIDRLLSAFSNKFLNGIKAVPTNAEYRFMRPALLEYGIHLRWGQPAQVTLQQFLHFVIMQKRKGIGSINGHWRPQSEICNPCGIPYEYIIRQETFEEDLQYIVHKRHIKEVNPALKKNSSVKKERKYKEYFDGISENVLREILELYKNDFYLYGYEVPDYFKKKIKRKSF